MLTPEQLEMRKHGIGGSEIAAILGESRFATPFDVWLSKTQGWVQPETEDMKRGTFLEDGIARWYADRFGITEPMHEPGTIQHPRRPIAICTPDRTCGAVGSGRLVSIKVPRRKGESWGEPGTDNVDPGYLLQLQWEWAICDAIAPGALGEEMHLAALVDGDLCVYVTRADRELQGWLLDTAEEWWARHVVGGEQPSLDGSSQAREWLKKFKDKGLSREATPHEVRLCVELQMWEQQAKAAEQEAEDRRNALKLSMGETSEIIAPSGAVRWRVTAKGHRVFKPKWTKEKS